MNAIQITGLSFSFGRSGWLLGGTEHEILKRVDLQIEQGEVFVLLGHNGAGKTTLLRILLSFLSPTKGSASILGIPIGNPDARSRVGYLSEQPVSYPHLDASSFLTFFGRMARVPGDVLEKRITGLLERTGLVSHGDKPLESYSKGMLQRVNLCRCLLNDPQVIFLDEPILGLDPLGQQLVKDWVRELRDAGKTVFINTHAVSFAREVGTRVGFLMSGEVVEVVRNVDLASMEPPFVAVVRDLPESVLPRIRAFAEDLGDGGKVRTFRLRDEAARQELVRLSAGEGFPILRLDGERDPVEKRFLEFASRLDAREKSQ